MVACADSSEDRQTAMAPSGRSVLAVAVVSCSPSWAIFASFCGMVARPGIQGSLLWRRVMVTP